MKTLFHGSTIGAGVGVLLLLLTIPLEGQETDLLIRNGHVYDAKNNIDDIMDVSIKDGKIFEVGRSLPGDNVRKIVDAKGMYVLPGLIDPHTHVFVGPLPDKFANGSNSLSPDDFSFRSGVTTVVDAGTSGWQNFEQFKEQVIDVSKTRVLAFLNIAGCGMTDDGRQEELANMNVDSAVSMIRRYPKIIVGVKIGHYKGMDWTPFDRAIEVGELSHTPLFVECHLPEYSLEAQLDHMRPGDIITHSFEHIDERSPVVDESGRVREYVLEAERRGIVFDLGHGGAGFWFDQGIPALEQGFYPHSFGTDLHRFSMNAGMKDILNVMSKFLAMGMPLNEVFKRGSWYPAQELQRMDLGNLDVGSDADIALIRIENGQFGYVDARGNRIMGNRKLVAELTVRQGKVVWDLNGLTAKPYQD